MILTWNRSLSWIILPIFIALIHFRFNDGYGDFDQLDEENFNDVMNGDAWPKHGHRAKRVVGGNYTDDTTVNSVTVTSSMVNGIYIITSFTDPNSNNTDTTYATQQTTEVTSVATSSSLATTEMTTIYSTSIYTSIYVVTSVSSSSTTSTTTVTTVTTVTTSTTTTTTSLSTTTTIPCNNQTHFLLNGTCLSREAEQNRTTSILFNNASSSTSLANALVSYATSIANTSGPTNPANFVPISQVENVLDRINTSIVVNNTAAIVVSTSFNESSDQDKIIGATLLEGVSSDSVLSQEKAVRINQYLTGAAVFSNETIQNATSMGIFLIADPKAYLTVDNTSGAALVSSIISARLTLRNGTTANIVISLYLTISRNVEQPTTQDIRCSFFDTDSNQWNTTGCKQPTYNTLYSRYECECYHLTSFALIWLPPTKSKTSKQPPKLEAADIVSIIVQSISIVCFIGIIIHGIFIFVKSSEKFAVPRNFFSLLGSTMTMVTFIFYIAAGLTVFSRYEAAARTTTTTPTTMRPPAPPPRNYEQSRAFSDFESRAGTTDGDGTNSTLEMCLRHESNLAFTFYFFLLLMFGVKSSAIYLNYEHYVRFTLKPSLCKLITSLVIPIVFSLIFVITASALHANPMNKVMAVVQEKLCWFTSEKIHYFLTLPVCLCCSIMIILTLLTFFKARKQRVIRRRAIYNTGRQGEEEQYMIRHQERRDKAAVILVASGLLQSFVWITGPLLRIDNLTATVALQWIFIIFNGLEGLWTILLYYIIRKDKLDQLLPSHQGSNRNTNTNPNPNKNDRFSLDDDSEREMWQTKVEKFDGIGEIDEN